MRKVLLFLGLFVSATAIAQSENSLGESLMNEPLKDPYEASIAEHREELRQEFANPQSSPLDSSDVVGFSDLPYFPIMKSYRVTAQWEAKTDQPVFEMSTTTSRKPKYRLAGLAHFTINGDSCTLEVYQNMRLLTVPGYEDYTFIPFTDYSNGSESYGGGRYVEAHLPEEGATEIVIDFNKAYNPYCAYSERYSCPLVPEANYLEVYIPAGVKYEGHH
ncbi:MAG: DUF1684 domain-containing protein [Schleiferiaceae bacterium]